MDEHQINWLTLFGLLESASVLYTGDIDTWTDIWRNKLQDKVTIHQYTNEFRKKWDEWMEIIL